MLKNIHVRVVLIHGDADPTVNIGAAREIAAVITGAKLIAIPGMGHAFTLALIDKIAEGILTSAKSR
jgi:pimeloyl-ACP methyl ester carboxylesterase